MRILLSNDDGFDAPGIQALYNHLKDDHEVWIIAPNSERSSTGHSLTLQSILRITHVEGHLYKCNGFPADCIHLGLQTVMKDCLPDLVISGINRGANLSQDIYYSGTCAAAREASFSGIPSLSLSLDVESGLEAFWQNLFPILDKIISEKIYESIPDFCSLNINAPNSEELVQDWKYCEIGFSRYNASIHHAVDPKGRDYYWLGSGDRELNESNKETDVYWVSQGLVSVSPCRWIPAEKNDFSQIEEKLGELN